MKPNEGMIKTDDIFIEYYGNIYKVLYSYYWLNTKEYFLVEAGKGNLAGYSGVEINLAYNIVVDHDKIYNWIQSKSVIVIPDTLVTRALYGIEDE